MNVQAAINAGLLVKFVYDRCEAAGEFVNLDGMDVVTLVPLVPAKQYRVLRTLYCNDLATVLLPNGPLRLWKTIGMIAQNVADETDVAIAVRGTEGVWEWLQDIKFLPRFFPSVAGSGLTEDGFTDMYLSFSLTAGPSVGTFMEDVKALLPTNAMVTVAGHSLGAALATLLALDMAANTNLPVGVYTLASPRVGDLAFHNLFNHIVPNAYRVANRMDIVTKTPPPMLYFHVGDETELRPGPNLKLEIPCEHHLESYLHMLGALAGQPELYPLDAHCSKAPVVALAAAAQIEGQTAIFATVIEMDV